MLQKRKNEARGYWQSYRNQKLFFETLAQKLSIAQPSDWGQITVAKIREHGGGTLMNMYNNSLRRALKAIFKGIQAKAKFITKMYIGTLSGLKVKAKKIIGKTQNTKEISSMNLLRD